MRRFLFPTAVLTLVLIVSCASPDRFGPFPPDHTPEPLGDVLFIGDDGNVYTVDPESRETTALTDLSVRYGGTPHSYDQPHWSPDGMKISYVAMHRSERSGRSYYLYVHDLASGAVRTHEVTAAQPPAYTQWAPDSRRLSFLVQSEETGLLEIVVWDTETDHTVRVLNNRPLFWDWSPSGDFLVAHGGTSSLRGGSGTVSIVRFDTAAEPTVNELDVQAGYFQVPAIAPSSDAFAMGVFSQETGTSLAVRSIETGETVIRGPLFSAGAFGWSPDGEWIAYITGLRRPTGEITGNLRIAQRESDVRLVSDRSRSLPVQEDSRAPSLGGVNAFYWSPDGAHLAFYRTDRRQNDAGQLVLEVRLGFIETATGRAFELPPERPTTSLSSVIIPYFDQYARSGSMFTTDGSGFLMNVQTPDNRPGIYLVDVASRTAELIAYGHMPVFRPTGSGEQLSSESL